MKVDERVLQIIGYMAIEKTDEEYPSYCRYCFNNIVHGAEHDLVCPHRLAVEVLEELKKEEQNEKNGQYPENYLAPSYSRS